METIIILWSTNIDLLDLILATLDDLEEGDKSASLIVVEIHSESIRYPAMDTTTTRVDPEEVTEAKGFWQVSKLNSNLPTSQSFVEDLHSRSNETPAAFADLLVRAASTDLVIVGHIDIENELTALRLKRTCRERLAVARLVCQHRGPHCTYPCTVLRSDLETRRCQTKHLFLKVINRVERVVSDVDVVLDCECELAVCPQLAGDWWVRQNPWTPTFSLIEPLEEWLVWEETAVECLHDLRRARAGG